MSPNKLKTACSAVALARKWKAGCDSVGPAIKAFEDLNNSTPPEKVKTWTHAAENAAHRRHHDYEAMDIYEVQSRQCK